jgi:hypothetical protein
MRDYWEENNLVKPDQYIVCAACQTSTGIIFCGARHWDMVMRSQAQAAGYKSHAPRAEEGFINQFGEFLTRRQAMDVVNVYGQKVDIVRNGSETELYSEGLY